MHRLCTGLSLRAAALFLLSRDRSVQRHAAAAGCGGHRNQLVWLDRERVSRGASRLGGVSRRSAELGRVERMSEFETEVLASGFFHALEEIVPPTVAAD